MNEEMNETASATEKVDMARNLLGMVLGGEDTINTLCIIVVREIIENVEEEGRKEIFEDLMHAMVVNFNIAHQQQTEKASMSAAHAVAEWATDPATDTPAPLVSLAAEIVNFREEVEAISSEDREAIAARVKSLLVTCNIIVDEAKPYKKDIEAFKAQKEAKAHELQARATRYGNAMQVLTNNANEGAKNQKLSIVASDFCEQLLTATQENPPALEGHPISMESVRDNSIFEKQIAILEAMALEVENSLKPKA